MYLEDFTDKMATLIDNTFKNYPTLWVILIKR